MYDTTLLWWLAAYLFCFSREPVLFCWLIIYLLFSSPELALQVNEYTNSVTPTYEEAPL